ncbi:MAG: cyclopropane-fatty-acyl-phospholipid synthase family protein [Pseudomonadota bacterium]
MNTRAERTHRDIAGRADARRVRQAAPVERAARAGILKRFARLRQGAIHVHYRGAVERFGEPAERFPEPVAVRINDPRAWPEIALNGALGSGEAYMRGWWQCSDLTGLVRILLVNRDVLESLEGGLARLGKPALRVWHWLQRNTRAGARRNIQAHYDLGDELFELFLDPTMAYSAAIFEPETKTLEQASEEKIDRLCRKLDLKPGERLLEIGSGWGALAVHAAAHYGCDVTTITLSENQRSATARRAAAAGVADRVDARLQDYRDVDGRYDKIVSVEMIEAVGYEHLPLYFGQLDRLLKDNGLVALQAITVADQNFRHALKSVDFIKKYIFPGGFLPSVTCMLEQLTRGTSLRLFHLEDIGFDYARTLTEWRQRFFANVADVRALGYSEVFVRMWEFYLSYCEGAFRERVISDVQMVLAKPGNRTPIRF